MKRLLQFQFILILFSSVMFLAGAQGVCPGYVLYTPTSGTTALLVDVNKDTVHVWRNLVQGNTFSVHLLPNGNILRPTNKQGMDFGGASSALSDCIQEIDPAGKVVWEFNYKTDSLALHHNVCPMPNGHILAVSYEKHTVEEAKDSGITNLPPSNSLDGGLLAERFIEIDPTKPAGQEIVWMWRIWDHLVKPENAAANPQLFSTDLGVDTGFMLNDWVHLNGFDYNEKLDQIVFTSRLFSELFIIDHSTTTAQAATHSDGKCGKGGDIIYRWGRPSNYKTAGTVFLNVVHCPLWVPEGYPGAGDITMFSNQVDSTTSAVLEIKPPIQANGLYDLKAGSACGPAQPFWAYRATKFKSDNMSSAQRLPNGNTLICLALSGTFREVTQSGDTVWTYKAISGAAGHSGYGGYTPTVMVARALKYAPDYPGIVKLLGGNGIESSVRKSSRKSAMIEYKSGFIAISGVAGSINEIYSLQGKKIFSLKASDNHLKIRTAEFQKGTYIVKVNFPEGKTFSKQINIM